ncbi:MAG: site-2 protease family protein [Armatimonadota bacterium]|nr:site-2 protease family protein [Armatimonadota bacterium]
MFAVLIALTVHEFAHAKSAQLAGDDTAERMGRVTLNPLAHLDPIGTLMIIMSSLSGFGIGWGKPVPVNKLKLRHPRWDDVKVSLWGPLSNLTLGITCGLIIRFFPLATGAYSDLLITGVLVNLGLAIFNLIPISPLDGSHIMSGLLPAEQAVVYERFMFRYGQLILLGMIFMAPGVIGVIIAGPTLAILKLLFIGAK